MGWDPRFFSEIEKFPAAVLAHHHEGKPIHGDFRQITDSYDIDLLVAGTPCQSFSVAGNGKGLDDPRGSLALACFELAHDLSARWILWENVPGVLRRGFGELLRCLDRLGYHVAWRVLDAQFFGVPQRRRRLYLVGYRGDWRPPAAVLFEPGSLFRHTEARRKTSNEIAGTLTRGAANTDENSAQGRHITVQNGLPRRLMPLEWERLQGFPDHYTGIPKASDTARYKALGNSMAVPVLEWLGRRIKATGH